METNQVSGVGVLPPFGKLFNSSFAFYKTHLNLIAQIAVVPFIVAILQALVPSYAGLLRFVLALVGFVVSLVAGLSLIGVATEKFSDYKTAFRESFGLFLPYLWLSILSGLAMAGGFILLVVPGIYIAVSLSLAAYVFLAEGKRGWDALVGSWHYVRGHWWAVFGRLILLCVLALVIFWLIMFVLGGGARGATVFGTFLSSLASNFLIMPFVIIFSAKIYRALRDANTGATAPSSDSTDQERSRKILKVLLAFGIVLLVIYLFSSGFYILRMGM